MALQDLYKNRNKTRKGKEELEDSLKLEEKKAERITQKYRNENPRRRVARDSQIRQLQKKEDVRKASKPTPTPKKVVPDLTPKKAPRVVDMGGRSAAPGSENYRPTNTRMGPNMGRVNKVGEESVGGGADNRSTMEKLFGASEERRQMGRDLQRKAVASMGMKKGGKVKKGYHKMPDGKIMKNSAHKKTAKCTRGDGCAKKGKTKGRMV